MASSDTLVRGQSAYATDQWADAYALLTEADDAHPLEPPDLEKLGRAAYMIGLDDQYVAALERAHQAYVAAGDHRRAVRCAFWIGHSFLFRGNGELANGWFARGERLVGALSEDAVEAGYLLIPRWLQQMGSGDYAAGYETTLEMEAIGERFGDPDLVWIARDEQARVLFALGEAAQATRLVDEILVIAASGQLSPIMTGIVYCNTIVFCRNAFELGRVRAWTRELSQWCDRQPQMIAHNGLCLVHRAEVMTLEGSLDASMMESQRALERFSRGVLNHIAQGAAHYNLAEVLRLRGDYDAAEKEYLAANAAGYEPQPGLALLRLAQGDASAAAGALRRTLIETTDALRRVALLPAFVEIMVATNELTHAQAAATELEETAHAHDNEVVTAVAAQARATVALVKGDPAVALSAAREAHGRWLALGVLYEAARVRETIGLACRALGDEDTAQLELSAAEQFLEGIRPSRKGSHGLSARELEVLRLLASGNTNRQIADALVISEHTVARHVQNILTKLGVSSRTAAGAWAFSHDLA